ncbi:hypothetical protein VFPFJ_09044 [Purpureocillium lilacinum]|uniref:Uncharacterized protein n=1 Tax=Purpureocillium lilacinum TaxID=33203 RepID=A0A179H188_PURLI|nr:hypothetical protein VFPFJ_09044 [Purpureocillium lilacinum]OAQ83241.1 hypothetical protein VFPFJ_09044 [Purpureocillium lilacinum]
MQTVVVLWPNAVYPDLFPRQAQRPRVLGSTPMSGSVAFLMQPLRLDYHRLTKRPPPASKSFHRGTTLHNPWPH